MLPNVSNQITLTLIGQLGDHPRFFGEAKQAARLNLSVNTSSRKDAKCEEPVDWLSIVCWKELATSCNRLAKGDHVEISGALLTGTFVDNGTQRRFAEVHATSVELLDVEALQAATAP